MTEVLLNSLDANADFVVLVEWVVPDGGVVKAGATICHVETSKTVTEITAPSAGMLAHRAKVGDKVEVGASLATISGTDGEPVQAIDRVAPLSPLTCDRVSRKALELMKRNDLEIADFPSEGFISTSDVEQKLSQRALERHLSSGGIFPLLDSVDISGLTFPDGSGDLPDGRLSPEFLARLREDPESFRRLPESERLNMLRQHGAAIAEGVRLGSGVIICAPQIVLRAGATIEAGGEVWCADRFIMGPLARFGPRLSVRCRQAVIGAAVWAENDIVIGGGGSRDPWAVIAIGDNCYIGGEVLLNTCRPVLIGRNVFITNRATLLTHNVGHSYLHGYENRFAPVVLEDASQVGINTVIYAGVRIGRGAVVGSNGYALYSIPPGKLALGVPARVAGDAQQKLSSQRQLFRAKEMFGDFLDLLTAKGYETTPITLGISEAFTVKDTDQVFGLILETEVMPDDCLPSGINWVVWTLVASPSARRKGTVVMDLLTPSIAGTGDPVWTDTVCEYLRKRGLKIQSVPWRYQGGLI